MKRVSSDLLIGGAIALVGVIVLLQNLGLFGPATEVIWALLFATGGVIFAGIVVRDRENWWALLPAATLLSIALLIGLEVVASNLAAIWGGTIFLGGLGLGFLAVYLLRPTRWWAIIPAGVLLTLGLIAGISTRMNGVYVGALLFFGLAATFTIVAIAPPDAPRRWAFIPAAVLLLMAVLLVLNVPMVMNFAWPTVLIVLGLGILYRAYRHREGKHYEDATVSQSH